MGKSDPYEYFCSVCNKSFSRAKTAKDHAQDKISTHPLGKDTPVVKRLKAVADVPDPDPDACDLLQQFVAVVAKLATTLEADTDFLALSRRLSKAVEPPVHNVDPECSFAFEQLPPKHELKRRLLDIFSFGVVPHSVWTHVHKHGTVRKSDREGHLQTFGVHGWSTRPAPDVAHDALERMQTRLEKMWLALKRDDPKGASVLRPAMLKFAAKKTIFMDGDVFDIGSDVVASKEAVAKTMDELSESFKEYAKVL